MKRPYEIPVLFRILSNEEEMQQAVDQVVAWIENSTEFPEAGKVTKIDRTRLGRRRLEYEIDGQRDGFYILFYADVDTRHMTELELNLKLYDAVLRYLVIRADEDKGEAPKAKPRPMRKRDNDDDDDNE